MTHYDAIVVGGGQSGLTAANHLAIPAATKSSKLEANPSAPAAVLRQPHFVLTSKVQLPPRSTVRRRR